MTTHELARVLLDQPDLPIATHANGHTYHSVHDFKSHGGIQLGLVKRIHSPSFIVVGNMLQDKLSVEELAIIYDDKDRK